MGTYVEDQDGSSQQARQSQAVGDLLHDNAGGAESGRGYIGTAEVVDHTADNDVDDGDADLADEKGARVQAGLAHLRGNGEEGGRAGVGEDHDEDGRDGLGKGR